MIYHLHKQAGELQVQTKGALSRSYGPRWHDYWSHPTSCGGGGGGNNLAGTFISATGQSCSYYVLFVQQEANNVYSAIISDTAGTASSALTINVDKLEYTGEKDDISTNRIPAPATGVGILFMVINQTAAKGCSTRSLTWRH
ncbi:MAG: hypothetical protein IKY92_08290 [Akkermansia sp.]|nr:hypothetical protein [Akkermansia sp.]